MSVTELSIYAPDLALRNTAVPITGMLTSGGAALWGKPVDLVVDGLYKTYVMTKQDGSYTFSYAFTGDGGEHEVHTRYNGNSQYAYSLSPSVTVSITSALPPEWPRVAETYRGVVIQELENGSFMFWYPDFNGTSYYRASLALCHETIDSLIAGGGSGGDGALNHTLYISAPVNGKVSAPTDQEITLPSSYRYKVWATPSAGYRFTRWLDNATEVLTPDITFDMRYHHVASVEFELIAVEPPDDGEPPVEPPPPVVAPSWMDRWIGFEELKGSQRLLVGGVVLGGMVALVGRVFPRKKARELIDDE